MLDVDRIQDVDQLRDVARLLARTVDHLQTKYDEIRRELAKVRDTAAQGRLSLEIEAHQAFLDRARREWETKVSEKRSVSESAPAKQQRGHGPRDQPNLPVDEQTHRLLECDLVCPACDGKLEEMPGQYEEADEITVVRRHFRIQRHKRQKYRCRCNGAVVTAPPPLKLIPGGRYSIDFAVEVAAGKNIDHLPLDRQRRMMEREGATGSTRKRTLGSDRSPAASPSAELRGAFLGHILSQPLIGADKTLVACDVEQVVQALVGLVLDVE